MLFGLNNWYSGRGKTMNAVKMHIMDSWKDREEKGKQILIGFQDCEATMHAARMTDACHCKFVQAQRMYTTKIIPKGSYGHWVIKCGKVALLNCNECLFGFGILIIAKASRIARDSWEKSMLFI